MGDAGFERDVLPEFADRADVEQARVTGCSGAEGSLPIGQESAAPEETSCDDSQVGCHRVISRFARGRRKTPVVDTARRGSRSAGTAQLGSQRRVQHRPHFPKEIRHVPRLREEGDAGWDRRGLSDLARPVPAGEQESDPVPRLPQGP